MTHSYAFDSEALLGRSHNCGSLEQAWKCAQNQQKNLLKEQTMCKKCKRKGKHSSKVEASVKVNIKLDLSRKTVVRIIGVGGVSSLLVLLAQFFV